MSKNLPFKEYRNLIFKNKQMIDLQKNHKFVEKYQLLATFLGTTTPEQALVSLPRLHLPTTPTHISALFQTDKPKLAICPGSAEKPSKKWSYFKELLAILEDKYEIFILGGKTELAEQGEFDKAIKNPTTHNLIDRIPLADVPFILQKCDLVITNDTGLMHIASSVYHPRVLAIFGSSNESWTPPLSPISTSISTDIYCRPCMQKKCPLGHHRCMREISVGAILQKIDELT